MRVYVYPADIYGCGHYRCIWPARSVAAAYPDVDVEVIDPFGDRQLGAKIAPNGKITKLIYPEDADVIMFQRPTHQFLSLAVPLLRERGVAVVIDMDDDLRTIHPRNPAFAQLHPKSATTMHTWQNAAQACRHASLVTTSSEVLAQRYGSHGRVRVISNRVPRRFLDVTHEDSTVVGWAGSLHSHPNDLDVLGASISNLERDGEVFQVVGTGDGVQRILGLQHPPEITGIIGFDDWPEEVTQLGVGIAPLADTAFNAAKSLLKPLEYAAVGVPWVASPRKEYKKLHDLGCGVLAEKPREWERELRRLIADEGWRRELSDRGRAVAATLTVEDAAAEWYEAWSSALAIQRDKDLVG